ncbi:MAG: exodeoxyribonuclease VII large subunit [Anaerolineae bacterium]|nr:exodeoxyribonuclease VII large subunit [Anaerolineae bacterium]
MLEEVRCLRVSELTEHIRLLINSDFTLQDVWVEGEISNFSPALSGNYYFSLKDEKAVIQCVMWRESAWSLSYVPSDGDHVIAHGYVDIYPTKGVYQLYVDKIKPVGIGLLYVKLEQLKARLSQEGLFDQSRKRPLPRFPWRIGLVTSPFGAAIRDILRIIGRRYPLAEIILSPAQVQGEEAPSSIVRALQLLNTWGQVDLIILARGGGSFEELMAFNDEQVVRAVASSNIPIVCGVGHEVDYTLADLAADLRAPTPSAAAEIAVPDREELRQHIRNFERRLELALHNKLQEAKQKVEREKRALAAYSPLTKITLWRQQVDELEARLSQSSLTALAMRKGKVEALKEKLEALNPLGVLKRGYALVYSRQGRIIKSVKQVKPGDKFNVRLWDGSFRGKAIADKEPKSPPGPKKRGVLPLFKPEEIET